jgi:hypothetical protein
MKIHPNIFYYIIDYKFYLTWPEVNRQLNYIWEKCDSLDIDKKISSKFLHAEAALFWLEVIKNEDLFDYEKVLNKFDSQLKATQQSIYYDGLKKKLNKLKFNDMIDFLGLDELFLVWNALLIKKSKKLFPNQHKTIGEEISKNKKKKKIRNNLPLCFLRLSSTNLRINKTIER